MYHRFVLAAALMALPSAAFGQGTLEQRVERMEAESDIRRILVEYGTYLDARDYAAYAGLFATNGEWVGGFGKFQGPEAIRKMLEDSMGKPEPGFVNKANFHMLTNPLIEIDGDRARVTSKYLFWSRSPDDRPTPLLAGRYEDEFVRENGQWKIARRAAWGEIPYSDPNAPPSGQGPNLTIQSNDGRIRAVEDQLAIQRILVEYSARLDARDFDGYADLFSREGVWQNGNTVRRGREEIKAMLVGLFGAPAAGFVNREDYHLVSNPQVDVDGDRATARSRHLLLMRGENGEPVPELAGLYEDEFIREDGQWKILRRVDNPIMPTREEWVKEMAARRGG